MPHATTTGAEFATESTEFAAESATEFANEFATEFATFRAECAARRAQPERRLSPTRPVWIFGAGQFGRDLCAVLVQQGFAVAGFVESRPRAEAVLGLSVVTWAQLSAEQRQAQLAIGVYNRGAPLDELVALAQVAQCYDIFLPWDLYAQFEAALGWRYWLSPAHVLLDHVDQLEQTWLSLSDTLSRECLLNICRFRLGLQLSYASFRHDTNQYFNELTLPQGGAQGAVQAAPQAASQAAPQAAQQAMHYVDGGAFNGDTVAELNSLHPIASAYLFEPDPVNFTALCQTVQSLQISAHCLPLALADRYQMLSFCAGNGEAGSIDANGNMHIAAMALDDLLHGQPVTFLKLDVEGAEISAIHGAAATIRRCRPILALSLYHRAQDLWEIPQLLGSVCEDYRFYLRQHFCNSFDSVLYAIPNPPTPNPNPNPAVS